MLADGAGVPPGLGTLLRGAPVRALEGGVLEVELIPGPALERLQDDAVRAALEAALDPHFAGTPEIRVKEGDDSGSGAGSGGRISQGEVRTGLLQDLLEKEPGLRPAVEELDLELMD
jgi:hypothetical protein